MKFKPASTPKFSGPFKDSLGSQGKASTKGPFSQAMRGDDSGPDRVAEGPFTEALQRDSAKGDVIDRSMTSSRIARSRAQVRKKAAKLHAVRVGASTA